MEPTEACPSCGGSGRQGCGTCGGRGGRHRVVPQGYDADGRPHDVERWESCAGCGGQGRRPCWRCGGTSRVPGRGAGRDERPATAHRVPRSDRERRDDFDLRKRDLLARLSDVAALGETRWEIADRLRAIDIDTPGARGLLEALEEALAAHPAYDTTPGLPPIRWDINWLVLRTTP